MNYVTAAPIIVVCLGTMLLLIFDLLKLPVPRVLLATAVCGVGWFYSWPGLYVSLVGFNGLLVSDAFTFAFNTFILGGTLLTITLQEGYLRGQGMKETTDINVLMLLAACGAMVMVAANELFVLFIGFELLSISVYVLAGSAGNEQASAESSLKYFVLGAFSSAFLLYGMVLLYAATGSMELSSIAAKASMSNPLVLCGLGLLIFGFGFKVSLVPFHVWTPDVYQGAPSSIAAFMAVVVKAAAFGAFMRVMYVAFGTSFEVWGGLLWTLSVVTMTVGNLVALRQSSLKRMLAYSSVAHAGYVLMGFLVLGPNGGGQAAIFYLLVYSLMTIAAFGVVLVATAGGPAQYENDSFESFRGLGWTHPFLGLVMSLAMLSLAGMPPLAGFVGKFYLFSAAVRGGYYGIAIIAALNSVVSLYYYLRVLVVMYFSGERKLEWAPPTEIDLGARIALTFATIGIIYFGLFSERFYSTAATAMSSLG